MPFIYSAKLSIAGQSVEVPIRSVISSSLLNGHSETRLYLAAVERGRLGADRAHAWVGGAFELRVSRVNGSARESAAPIRGYVRSVDGGDEGLRLVGASFDAKLDFTAKRRGFAQQSPVDVCQQLAGEAGVEIDVSRAGDSAVRDYLAQYDESDYRFALRLAARDGLITYERDGKWTLCDAIDSSNAKSVGARELEGRGRVRLDPAPVGASARRSAFETGESVEADSVDFRAPTAGLGAAAAEASTRAFGNAASHQHDTPTDDRAEMSTQLALRARAVALRTVTVEFTTRRVDLSVGDAIQVEGIDHLAKDELLAVVAVRHEWSEGGRYACHVTAVPVDHVGPPALLARRPVHALHEAVVVDDDDDDGLGRVHVRFPWDDTALAQARVLSAGAGAGFGCAWTPRPGSRVVVAFLEGDPDKPMIIGASYDGRCAPRFETRNGGREVLLVRTKAGAEVRVLENDGGDELVMGTAGKALVRLRLGDEPELILESARSVVVRAPELTLDGDRSLTVRAGRLRIEAEELEVTSTGAASVVARRDLTLDGARVVLAP